MWWAVGAARAWHTCKNVGVAILGYGVADVKKLLVAVAERQAKHV